MFQSVLVKVSIDVIKYHDQKQLEGRVIFDIAVHYQGKSGQELKLGRSLETGTK